MSLKCTANGYGSIQYVWIVLNGPNTFCKKAGGYMKNIVLVGLPGTGKSALGRVLAKKTGYQFYDTDESLEALLGMSLRDIIKKLGKIRFFSEEQLLCRKLAAVENSVIALGGILFKDENLQLLAKDSFVVYIEADPEVMLGRIRRKGNAVLLPKRADAATLAAMAEKRQPFYQKYATLTVDLPLGGLEAVADQIIAGYKDTV